MELHTASELGMEQLAMDLLVNNASQSDSFSVDMIITALQKRNQFDANGCPPAEISTAPGRQKTLILENKSPQTGKQ